MIVGLFATLIVTSSEVPGTAWVLQLFPSCQDLPSPPPVQRTGASTRRGSRASSAGPRQHRALRTTETARAVVLFTGSIRCNLDRAMAVILSARTADPAGDDARHGRRLDLATPRASFSGLMRTVHHPEGLNYTMPDR